MVPKFPHDSSALVPICPDTSAPISWCRNVPSPKCLDTLCIATSVKERGGTFEATLTADVSIAQHLASSASLLLRQQLLPSDNYLQWHENS